MRKLDDKGNAAILLCLGFTVLLGFTAFVIDIGIVYAEKIKLSNALDAAALAAALDLPDNTDKARTAAIDYLQKNNVDPNQTRIIISSDNKSIEIEGNKNVKHLFAEIIGISSSKVHADTKAAVSPVKAVSRGLRPFAVQKYNFNYGERVRLKAGAGDGYDGNYGAVVLGGQGENVFRANALYGYSGTVSVGDYIDTEPGNMAGAANDIKNYINSEDSTFENFPRNSIRLWTIPLVASLTVNGQKAVQVVGFADFYVEDVTGTSGNIEVYGRFVKYASGGITDANLDDTGAYGARLTR